MYFRFISACVTLLLSVAVMGADDRNRLAYLDESDPYYVSGQFPRLVTPQWVGEPGVQAVVILSIDDMRDPAKYEAFTRPILRRLQQIDGRAALSIMTNAAKPEDSQLQRWLDEGLSIECHTIDHPCPCLNGDFGKARSTYDRCVDLLSGIPRMRPVAFRMPCCDSLNTPSPRFYSEIFNQTTPQRRFLTIDSSVFTFFTANDPTLPRDLVLDNQGRERFRKYLPADRSFVNTIEDYPYPYVLGRLCWEFPCVTPSDWQAQHLHQSCNPETVRDWKAAMDATVRKQGVFTLVFHPHGWIKSEQIVDFIDYVVATHGPRVKFLTFREAEQRLNRHLLRGQPLRNPATGADNGVRLIDLNGDGFLDVVIGNRQRRVTRLWSRQQNEWTETDFPVSLVSDAGANSESGVRFGVVRGTKPSLLVRNESVAAAWTFDGTRWVNDSKLLAGLELDGKSILTSREGLDRGVRLRDLDGDGCGELIVSNPDQQAIFTWDRRAESWRRLAITLPPGAAIVDRQGRDFGLRFVDIDEDGHDDVLFANEQGFGLYFFSTLRQGWDRKVLAGKPGDPGELPTITRNGANDGVWFHSRHLWAQNERTAILKDHVDRRSFNQLLAQLEPTAKSAKASLHSIQTRPGFTAQQMAAEPLVQSPIAMAWGPDGKFWVVEMGDYPTGLDGKGKPGGRIKYLESTKGDGHYDKVTLFLDGIPFPTSVLPWRKGVLVTAAPEIFYAEDTDGDGKADKRETLFVGFTEGNPQHRVNSLAWGLDNWIYCANGDSGGKIRSVKTGKVVELRGRDFRIRPDTGEIEPQAGQTQYGRSRDDWGNWFGNNNSNPMWHFALADHYLRRNPHLAAPDGKVQLSNTPGAAPVYPISRTMPRFNDLWAANHFTSACSAIVYRDDLFGPAFVNSTFVSEPVHNLVHRERMTPRGYTFASRRAIDEQQSEFLASSDNWFRPTSLATGPDGALWIADMYRYVIEHPEWIPKDWQQRLDLRAGHDRGRIYRVFPIGAAPRPIPRLDSLDTAGLVAALDSPNGWQRDTVQQMLLWRADPTAVPLLERLALECPRPLARLHALCALDGLKRLSETAVRHALGDSDPGVRRHAVRLCEPCLQMTSGIGDLLIELIGDADPQVRLQLAYTLGEWKDARAGTALGRLALRDASDPLYLAAVMSSVHRENLEAMLLAVMNDKSRPNEVLLENLLKLATSLNHSQTLTTLLAVIVRPDVHGRFAGWQYQALAGLLDTLEQSNQSLASFAAGANAQFQASLKELDPLFASARGLLADENAGKAERLLAVRVAGRGGNHQGEDRAGLVRLLGPQTPDDLQTAAVTALGRFREPEIGVLLLQGWRGYSPRLRSQVLEVLLARPTWAEATLAALESKDIAVAEIGAAARQRFLEQRSASHRDRAARLFAGSLSADRQKVIDSYKGLDELAPDAARGKSVYVKNCAGCHRIGELGHAVGPDITSVGDKSTAGLLVAVLDPNRVVETRYLNYVVLTKNGLTLNGVLSNESDTSITLLAQDGKQQVLLRGNIEEMASTGKSLMPEGLEKEIDAQSMADLFAFIRAAVPSPKPKVFTGNKPELVRVANDGSLLLTAKNAEIYGRSLVFEAPYGNLGYWTSDDDRAIWSVEIPQAGRYAVALDWACDPGSSGKAFVLDAGGNQLTGRVASTGSWDTYHQARIGELILSAGRQQITLRPAGQLHSSALIDLRSIKLAPVSLK